MKLHEISSNQHAEIEAELIKYKIENYTIHPDGTVDVNGSVNFSACEFTEIPIKFGTVTGAFCCGYNEKLVSLKGAPNEVHGNFSCFGCPNLISLVGSPSSVGAHFACAECTKLSSLAGAPASVGGYFNCDGCNIESLEGFNTNVGSEIYVSLRNVKSGGISLVLSGASEISDTESFPEPFTIIAKYLGRPEDIFECQAELIEAGYADYAIL